MPHEVGNLIVTFPWPLGRRDPGQLDGTQLFVRKRTTSRGSTGHPPGRSSRALVVFPPGLSRRSGGRAGDSRRVLAPGRVWEREGCDTVLYQYNRDLAPGTVPDLDGGGGLGSIASRSYSRDATAVSGSPGAGSIRRERRRSRRSAGIEVLRLRLPIRSGLTVCLTASGWASFTSKRS